MRQKVPNIFVTTRICTKTIKIPAFLGLTTTNLAAHCWNVANICFYDNKYLYKVSIMRAQPGDYCVLLTFWRPRCWFVVVLTVGTDVIVAVHHDVTMTSRVTSQAVSARYESIYGISIRLSVVFASLCGLTVHSTVSIALNSLLLLRVRSAVSRQLIVEPAAYVIRRRQWSINDQLLIDWCHENHW